MFDFRISKLSKTFSNEKEYSRQLEELYQDISFKEDVQIANDLINLIKNRLNDIEFIIAFDILLKLKSKKYFTTESIDKLNICIITELDIISDNEIRLYAIGYIIQNNLIDMFKVQDKEWQSYIETRTGEIQLANDIVDKIKNIQPISSRAIKVWIQTMNNDMNIFKIGEVVRRELSSESDILNLNLIIKEILNNFAEQDNVELLLEFIFSLYQDDKFVDIKNLEIINLHMSKNKSKFLENMFIEITSRFKFNRIMNSVYRASTFQTVARGKASKSDFVMLNNYLNRTIKISKKLKLIDMKYSYKAEEIIKMLKIPTDSKIDLNFIMKKLQIQYYEDNFDEDILGYSFRLQNYNKASIILNKRINSTEERRRFTIAHEIGHICCKEEKEISSHDNLYNIHSLNMLESSANEFASLLLIPTSFLENNIKEDITMNDVIEIAKRFGVSIEATAIRLVKWVRGSFSFTLYKNNECKYIINSDYVTKSQVKEEVYDFILETNNDVKGKYIEGVKIDIKILNNFKYVMINHQYMY